MISRSRAARRNFWFSVFGVSFEPSPPSPSSRRLLRPLAAILVLVELFLGKSGVFLGKEGEKGKKRSPVLATLLRFQLLTPRV